MLETLLTTNITEEEIGDLQYTKSFIKGAYSHRIKWALARMFGQVEKHNRRVKEVVLGKQDFGVFDKHVEYDKESHHNIKIQNKKYVGKLWGASVFLKNNIATIDLVNEDGKKYTFKKLIKN